MKTTCFIENTENKHHLYKLVWRKFGFRVGFTWQNSEGLRAMLGNQWNLKSVIFFPIQWTSHKTKRHHSVKTERRHSVTFQSPFSRLNGRYISVIIQWPFSAIQCHSVTIPSPFSNNHFPFFRIKLILYALFHYNHYIFNSRSPRIMSECYTHIIIFLKTEEITV